MLRKLFRLDHHGDQFTELGLILALVVVVAIGALSGLGQQIVQILNQAAASI